MGIFFSNLGSPGPILLPKVPVAILWYNLNSFWFIWARKAPMDFVLQFAIVSVHLGPQGSHGHFLHHFGLVLGHLGPQAPRNRFWCEYAVVLAHFGFQGSCGHFLAQFGFVLTHAGFQDSCGHFLIEFGGQSKSGFLEFCLPRRRL